MNLPIFDGNPEQWLQFRDSFQGLIDTNTELSNIQRMFYLRSSLKGRAADVIQALESSATNYGIAWDLLKRRFEDKTAITSRHLQLLLEIPAMHKESGRQLRQTLDSILRHIRALEQLEANKWDTVIIHLLTSKLDYLTKREWRSYSKDKENIIVKTLTDVLEDRCLIFEPEIPKPEFSKQPTRSERRTSSQPKGVEQSNAFTTTSEENQISRKCAYCLEASHQIYSCNKFRELSVSKRNTVVKEQKLCRNCLRRNHIAANCTSTHCKRCENKHNTLLHPDGQSVGTNQDTNTNGDASSERAVVSAAAVSLSHWSAPSRVILSTARIWIYGKEGTRVECRVLLDSGSQFNFMTQELCQHLRLNTREQSCSVKGLGPAINLSASAGAVIESKHTAYRTKRRFLATEKIIEKLPLTAVEIGHLQIPSNINLADNTFNIPSRVDVLLGATTFWDLLCIGQIKLGRNQPILQKTHLGWIAAGDITPDIHHLTALSCMSADAVLHENVEKFWNIEEVGQTIPRSRNDELCEIDFVNHYRRDATGRFTVNLPIQDDPGELGESRCNALRRFYKIERKLERAPEIRDEYIKLMTEYQVLGHMTALSKAESVASNAYYIPHHAVVKTVNERIKLRVVFDASAKTTSGKSLNDIMRVGPTIQPTLFETVLRFRQYQYVMTADIVKMYRQINIGEEHRKFQRIFWRSDSTQPVQEYQLNTVTYGLAPAPFLAIRAIQQIAHDVQESHPAASRVIYQDFYVDDLLTGHDDLVELQSLKRNLIDILRSACFELAKWKSNVTSLVTEVTNQTPMVLKIGEEVKTLGLGWASEKDTLQYQVNFQNADGRVTKRTVLSITSQIFDPLGLVGPCTIKAKILLQRMWQLNLKWDESLPIHLHTEWVDYVEQLTTINKIRVPRWISCQDAVRIEIHGFCDASESAYGACIYIRSIDKEGRSTIRLLCGKSKVAPLKTICVPRLELCGALLLARLVHRVTETLTITIHACFYWCDSTIVLAWINGEPRSQKTFVANRITEIQELTSRDMWHHVRSEDNPADVISRGVSPNQLENLSLWWHGPDWLSEPEEHINKDIPLVIGVIPETKPNIVTFTQVLDARELIENFSSLSRLKRVTAYCLRWKEPRNTELCLKVRSLSVKELNRAMKGLIKSVQAHAFHREIHDLRNKHHVSHNSLLLTLHPFLDDEGVIRVGGRLNNAKMEFSRQHPIVLPAKHHLTHLIIRDEHLRNLHLGAQALHSTLRETFWILAARSTIRHILHKCIICFRARPAKTRHIMGDLPECRVSSTRAFINVGVDYGGPFNLKLSRNKTCKAYICVFVCMSTKAIHIE